MSTKRLFFVLIAVVGLVVAACAPQGAPTPTATSVPDATPVQASVAATTPPTAEAPAEPGAATGETGKASDQVQIQGMFDVGGHKLYMSCKGDGSPTIVYLHGSITDESFSGASSAVPI